jgi:hypothetical protein
MANANNTPANDSAAQLAALVGDQSPTRLFTPDTFLKKNGTVCGQIKPQGAGFYGSISVPVALMIIQHREEFIKAAIEAAQKAKDPNEASRLQAEKAQRDAAKKGNAKPAAPAPAASANDELAAQLAALAGGQ